MEYTDIIIISDGIRKTVPLHYSTNTGKLRLDLGHLKLEIKEPNLYQAFGKLRGELPNISFLCKGAKINVHPSRMSSQMGSGLMAYELTLGTQALRANLVNIFTYADTDLTNNYLDQELFFKKWISSLGLNR